MLMVMLLISGIELLVRRGDLSLPQESPSAFSSLSWDRFPVTQEEI